MAASLEKQCLGKNVMAGGRLSSGKPEYRLIKQRERWMFYQVFFPSSYTSRIIPR